MSIQQCEDTYDVVSRRIFEHKAGNFVTRINDPAVAFMAGSYMYDSKPLEDQVRELVKQYIPGATGEEKLQDPSNTPDVDSCKV